MHVLWLSKFEVLLKMISPTGPTGGTPHLLNLGSHATRNLREPIVHTGPLWIRPTIYTSMLLQILFLIYKTQDHFLGRLPSRRVHHYDFHGAISTQRGPLRGLDALWHGLQYLFQWFVEGLCAVDMRVILTRFRV